MPSVRVKKHSYTSLRPQRSRSGGALANLFRRTSLDADETEPSHSNEPQTAGYAIDGDTRRRTRSRLQKHLLQTPLLDEDRRRARALSVPPVFRPTTQTSPNTSVVTLEGATADIQLAGDGAPGLIDSALSLSDAREDHHHDDIVEHLDVIDPQVATACNLTNAANSILIPPLDFYSRKPVLTLTPPPLPTTDCAQGDIERGQSLLEDSLDRHVDDVMRRRDKIRRILKGVWSFLKTPLGIITGIYGFLVVFWGAAIVVFLLKIINFHNANTQGFWVEVSSQVVNGLFTVTGIGLIPSRVLDTYRIGKIYSYKRRTRELRRKAGLPQLFDEDDLPDPIYDPNYVHVLTDEEQRDLHRQQTKFHHSQTWYRPHGTETHRAFPIGHALLICCLNDGNSIFQIMLCGTMWGLNRFERPAWSTGCLIPLGFLCGIGSAAVIAFGSAKTKRTAEVEKRLKAALASDDSGVTSECPMGGPSNNRSVLTHAEGQLLDEKPSDDAAALEEHKATATVPNKQS
ncbi:hypothetical protein GYMLUDRAFT_36853 [Collybiopsis luxurians FD-317 M1]|nr:hypothetical protein GYMLUDRAFT_36853 [Collybiopsis luxurians FD-317 M1]